MIFLLATIAPANAVIPAAVEWAVGTLLGSVATGVAVLAVAFLGFGMLFGHLDWRTGVRVLLGIFILFGAPLIARELATLARGDVAAAPNQVASGAVSLRQEVLDVPKNAPAADPYAGVEIQQ